MGPSDLFAAAGGTGALTKLTIVAFEKPEQDGQAEDVSKYTAKPVDAPDVFEAFYNPNTFSSTYGITFGEESPQGASGKLMPFKEYANTTYSFDLLLDGTGASIPSGGYSLAKKIPTVPEMIEKFLQVAYRYRGEEHRPPYLRLQWGTTSVRRCLLTSATVKHDLFKADGTSLRATISCSFSEYWTEEMKKAFEAKKSPDMTHVRVVQQGDRLSRLCEQIYGDANLYLQVARFNKLTNYRDIQPGTKIYFPPLVTSKT